MPFRTPSSFVPGFAPVAPPGPKLYFLVHRRGLLVSERFELPCVESLVELGVLAEREEFLGTLEGQSCVMALLDVHSPLPEGGTLVGLRALIGRLRPELLSVAGRAMQVAEWERTHRFCGACGTPTERVPEKYERRCPACEHCAFPRLSPAIIVAVEKGDTILLARGPHFPPDVHSCLAGFVEPGESVEEAVHREVHEEVGLRVRNVRYFDSQPWPFPHSLMLGFTAEHESGEIRVDGEEIVSADFFHPSAMPPMFPGRVSISQWLIEDFLQRHDQT